MHNCKTTRDRITELLLDGADPRVVLATELRVCTECRAEFVELSETLRAATRLLETAAPAESYWPGYHARLKDRLRAAQQPRVEPGQSYIDVARRSWVTRLFFSSIRVPVPVGVAVLVIVGFLIFNVRVPVEPAIVHVPVEVPVVQEKIVTQIVYRERPARPKRSKPTQISSRNEASVASLQGFTPTDEVKLTVIKGGSANEK